MSDSSTDLTTFLQWCQEAYAQLRQNPYIEPKVLTTIQAKLYSDGLRVLPEKLAQTLPPPPRGFCVLLVHHEESWRLRIGTRRYQRYFKVRTALKRVITWAHARRKRNTAQGDAKAKLIAALTKHHQYADGGCLNLEPIGNNKLAKMAGVSASTASAFFNEKFEGYAKYKAICRNAGKLATYLKLLNDEFAPYHLLGDASSDLAAPDD